MTARTVICICVVASIMGALADDLPPQVDDVPPQPLPKDRVLEMLQSMKSSADRAARSTLQSAKSGAERAARALSPYTPDVVKRNPKASVAVAAGTTALLGTLLATRKSAANPPVKPAPKRSAEQSKIAQLKNSISVDKYKSFVWVEWVLIGVPVCILSVLLTSAFACCCCGRRSYDKGYYASDVY